MAVIAISDSKLSWIASAVFSASRALASRVGSWLSREHSHEEFAVLLGERFGSVEMFGQNRRRGWRVRAMAAVGRVLPGNLGGRLTSVLKLPRLAFDRDHHHAVVSLPAGGTCEYLVAVCRHPRRP